MASIATDAGYIYFIEIIWGIAGFVTEMNLYKGKK